MATETASEFVEAVEKRIALAMVPSGQQSDVLVEASRRLCLLGGGKRVRPRLVLLLGEAIGAPRQGLEDIAVAAELIHAASLLHDDVVDEATLRRGQPTANARFGNAVAVLAGDWLLSTAFMMLEKQARQLTTEAINLVAEMSRAAVLEVDSRNKIDLSMATWKAVAEGKTGALFAWCGQSVARIAGKPELMAPLSHFGLKLGVAFQLADDLKDLAGGEPGKNRFSDLKNKNPSYPIIWASTNSPSMRAAILKAWSKPALSSDDAFDKEAIEKLGLELLASGAADAAATALAEETAAAVSSLKPLGDLHWAENIVNLARSFAQTPSITPEMPS